MSKRAHRCFLKDDLDGRIKCKDGLYRGSVCFGTPNWTCKFWRHEGWARRAAEADGLKEWTIVHVYEGDVVEHDGHVVRGEV